MKTITTCTLAAFAGLASLALADDVAYWAFNSQDLPGGGFGYTPDEFPFPAEFGDQAGTATIDLAGGILDETTTSGGGDLVLRWVQSFSGTTLGARFGEPAGGSLAIQGGTDTLNNGASIIVSFDASALTNLAFQFDGRRTSTGFNAIAIDLYDGDVLLQTVEAALDLPSDFTTQIFDIGALDGVADARIVLTIDGATSTSGNIRTDNWAITGDGGSTPCRADIDGDGALTLFDFLQFQNLFDAGDLRADFDGDGVLTLFDFLTFQNEFDAGC
ncbi:MAG: hypothetical protein KatS3mg103_0966 [Phycisphaerales bacterium]|nr:MAG: hypothetical protein KatS3mg103_0966 [Phycisphaerales bacterium]